MIFLTALFPGWMMNELIAYIFIDFKTIRFWCTSLYLFSIFSNAHRVKSMTTVLWNGYSRLRLNFWKGLPKTQTSTLLKICEVGLKTGYFQGNQPINFTNSAKKSCQISSQSYTRNCFFGGFFPFFTRNLLMAIQRLRYKLLRNILPSTGGVHAFVVQCVHLVGELSPVTLTIVNPWHHHPLAQPLLSRRTTLSEK